MGKHSWHASEMICAGGLGPEECQDSEDTAVLCSCSILLDLLQEHAFQQPVLAK